MASAFRQIPPCRISPEAYDQLAALAASDDRSVSYTVLLFIAEGLAAHGDKLAATSEERTRNSELVSSVRRRAEQQSTS